MSTGKKRGRKAFADTGMKRERLEVFVEGRMIVGLGGKDKVQKWCAQQIISEWERVALLGE